MSFEEAIQNRMMSGSKEKTFMDKVLAVNDVTSIREIVKKDRLTRSDLLELLYLLTSTESKLLNYGLYDRYIILKYFVWIREFVKLAEIMYDYRDDHEKNIFDDNMYKHRDKLIRLKNKKIPDSFFDTQKKIPMGENAVKLLENNQRMIEHNIKFLVDLYFNIARTTLSIGGTGFFESLKQKFELVYPQAGMSKQAESGATMKA